MYFFQGIGVLSVCPIFKFKNQNDLSLWTVCMTSRWTWITQVIEAGANALVAGSAVFGAKSYADGMWNHLNGFPLACCVLLTICCHSWFKHTQFDLLVDDPWTSLKRGQVWISISWTEPMLCTLDNAILMTFSAVMTWYSHQGHQDKQEAHSSSSASIGQQLFM